MSSPQDAGERLAAALGLDDLLASADGQGTVCLDVPVERWHDALGWARDELGLDFFDWLSAVDEPEVDPAAVDVVVHLACSIPLPDGGVARLLLRTRVPADSATLASVSDLWPGAAWHERETHEMFGLDFSGFQDGTDLGLRPLLLPDGFEGTPLRKSFVLAARASKPWPGAKEPGESDAGTSPSRRKMLPPGVPDQQWGPRDE
ncbi:NADH-quinone oxidoreductase subunit C [Angustibacter luteus]|uniref:NADH-quinone oxidoreductase subunit C n=1 Tax=Angustibacter luteus TaxID=658456 RepID=A0ABW1JG00_9ACTN